jgi:hypothetical protein
MKGKSMRLNLRRAACKNGPIPNLSIYKFLNGLSTTRNSGKIETIGGSFLLKGDIRANCEKALSIIYNI